MQLRDTITSQKMLPRKAYRNDDDKLLKAKEDEKVFGGGFSLVSSDTVFYKLSKSLIVDQGCCNKETVL